MSYLTLALLWISWCVLHSVLISRRVVAPLERRYGDGIRYHRIVFNAISILTLIPVLFYSHTLRGRLLFDWSGPWRLLQILLAFSAIVLFLMGGSHYDLLQFLGVRQIRENETKGGLTETGGLDKSGILGVIRHPWYTAGILIIWARPMDTAALVTNAVLTVYFIIGTYLEEGKLVEEFGDCYRKYQREVPMFFPGWRKNRRNISKSIGQSGDRGEKYCD